MRRGWPRWIRLLYCYPEHITDELLSVMRRQPKVLRYLDVPLQHCSGRVLRAMNRPGDRESLTALFGRIREALPGVVLRTTILVGFPGETEADFEELCAFIKELRFERLGCFAFSSEEGTPAASMPGQIPETVKSRRRDIVMQTQERIADAYNQAQLGKTLDVLVESFDGTRNAGSAGAQRTRRHRRQGLFYDENPRGPWGSDPGTDYRLPRLGSAGRAGLTPEIDAAGPLLDSRR